jgi:hypothetical protein
MYVRAFTEYWPISDYLQVSYLPTYQGDQIGRYFAYWAIANFGNFLKIMERVQIFGVLFSTEKVLY